MTADPRGAMAAADYRAWVAQFAGTDDVTVVIDPDLQMRITETDSRYLNLIHAASFDPSEADDRIRAAMTRMVEGRPRPYRWMVDAGDRPADLADRLLAHGFAEGEPATHMAADLRTMPDTGPVPDGLRIDPAQSREDVEAIDRFLAADGRRTAEAGGVADAVAVGAIYRSTFERTALGADRTVTQLLGRVDGRLVATSVLFTGADHAGIYAVQTDEAFRNRGIGRAMTAAAMALGRDAGYETAVLMASSMGAPVYRRLGFEAVGNVRFFLMGTDAW